MDKLVLIDGHSILNRAFYGVPDLTNAEGLHTNAVYGFLNIMLKILEEEKADHLAVAFDLPEPTFRHKMFDAYKGTRKPMPEELREQVPLIKEALTAMEIPILTLAGYEADDILGTVAKRCQEKGAEVSVVSGDRDLLQLADSHIKIRIPKTSRGTTEIHDYYPEDVKREYQVSPEEFIDVKALMGDSSDNIPGVPSIGEKTATSLIVSYGSIENAYAHLEEIRPPRAQKALGEHYDLAQMSKELATICTHCPVEFSYEDAKVENLYTPQAFRFMKRMGFKSILSRFDAASMSGTDSEEEKIQKHFKAVEDKKEALENQAILDKINEERIDITLPSFKLDQGSLHPLSTIVAELEDLFLGMGYQIAEGPEVESDYFNFELMNLPKGHPARDMQDTFYIDENTLMRTHTSPVQAHTMLAANGEGPIKVICPGKTYRRDDDDATHSHQFMQCEGLVVDKNITMADLKGTLEVFARKFFGEKREVRLRPSYFPFTEPSVEVDISCHNCGGKGCPMCKHTGWIEILGAGMVNPRVLEMCGFDSEVYQGFAFGIGIERVAMLKYGIDNIRNFYNDDIRFLSQFGRKE